MKKEKEKQYSPITMQKHSHLEIRMMINFVMNDILKNYFIMSDLVRLISIIIKIKIAQSIQGCCYGGGSEKRGGSLEFGC
ncbi:MAG: hypothetical protein EZS28_010371 [Streblomastix strix]|uniref:Uncharacterized protein n=1 Tax=Streblomastix strix TaxID=222440 RepID=A0A5J4WGF5_9EUKA|nr:MAG: hypothetical protein EZS28_010371 [Streblomastix strix]